MHHHPSPLKKLGAGGNPATDEWMGAGCQANLRGRPDQQKVIGVRVLSGAGDHGMVFGESLNQNGELWTASLGN